MPGQNCISGKLASLPPVPQPNRRFLAKFLDLLDSDGTHFMPLYVALRFAYVPSIGTSYKLDKPAWRPTGRAGRCIQN